MRIGSCRWLRNLTTRCDDLSSTHLLKRQFVGSVPSRSNASSQVKQRRDRTYTIPSDFSSEEATFARHVLRTILRECTYLPDRFAADYIKHHTLARFRTNAYKAWKDSEQFEMQYKTRRKEARQVISTLQRANEGNRDCLLKVLHTAYGRIGKRRHELMKPLLYVKGTNEVLNAPVDSDRPVSLSADTSLDDGDGPEVEKPSQHVYSKLSVTAPLDLTPQLRALLKSQIRVKPPDTARTNPKRVEPTIPELNSWHRPMPQRRIRNARRKQYAKLLERVQVPLPTEAWERLRDLALGKVSPEQPISRRTKAKVSLEKGEIYNGIQIERESSALEMVARYGKPPRKATVTSRGHEYTPRYMQRLYREVFSQCPLLEWKKDTEDWQVTWGFQLLLNVDQRTRGTDSTAISPAQSTEKHLVLGTEAPDMSTIKDIS